MTQRIIWGAVFGIIMIAVFFCKIDYVFIIFCTMLALFGTTEFYNIAANYNSNFLSSQKFYNSYPALISAATVMLLSLVISNKIHIYFAVLPLIFIYSIFIYELYFGKLNDTFLNLSVFSLALVYVIIPILCSVLIAFSKNHYEPMKIFGIIILIWTSDTMQYFSGKFFGKHKLIEHISPKKTIEGVIGGLIFTIIASIALSKFINNYTMIQWMSMAVIVVLMGITGDLVESMFKRKANLKDSGNIIPGHGGILDRFDSYLLIMPFAFIFDFIINHSININP